MLWGITNECNQGIRHSAVANGIAAERVHELSVEFISKEKAFAGHQIYLATHTDKEYFHTHIVVNSVNVETGLKVQLSGWGEYKEMKKRVAVMSQERGLGVQQVPDKWTGHRQEMSSKYEHKPINAALNGKAVSWKLDTYMAVMQAKEITTSREQFIQTLKGQGYKVTWTDQRANITFENTEGRKVRNSNLEKTFQTQLGKEVLENDFRENRYRQTTIASRSSEQNNYFEGAATPKCNLEQVGVREQFAKGSVGRIGREL